MSEELGGGVGGSGDIDKLMLLVSGGAGDHQSQSQTRIDDDETNDHNPPVPHALVPANANVMRKKRRKGKQGVAGMGAEEEEEEGRGGGGGGGADQEDLLVQHLWTERERRKKMKDMFSNLHQMLPHVPIKADKSTIVDEAVSYIQNLQVILQEFQRRYYLIKTTTNNAAAAAAAGHVVQFDETWCWPNLVLNVCGEQAQFSVCASKKPNISSSICFFFETHNLDVVFCNLISNQSSCIYMIHAQVRKSSSAAESSSLSSSTNNNYIDFSDIFKRAAIDITTWLSSQ